MNELIPSFIVILVTAGLIAAVWEPMMDNDSPQKQNG
jgi:hypothetical protein